MRMRDVSPPSAKRKVTSEGVCSRGLVQRQHYGRETLFLSLLPTSLLCHIFVESKNARPVPGGEGGGEGAGRGGRGCIPFPEATKTKTNDAIVVSPVPRVCGGGPVRSRL